MVLMAQEVAENRADACISAGNTGALMTAGLFIVGRIKGIDRPALAPTLPTVSGDGFLLWTWEPMSMPNRSISSSTELWDLYMRGSRNQLAPRRIVKCRHGRKERKRPDKKTFELLKETNVNFVGNVEARDLLEGALTSSSQTALRATSR